MKKQMYSTRKKVCSLLTVFTLLLTGCSGSDSSSDDGESSSKKENKTEATETVKATEGNNLEVDADVKVPERVDGTITLSLGFSTSVEDPRGVASLQFKDEVEKNTNRTVKVTIYADSEKGNDAELIDKVTTGEVDMTVSSAGNFTGYVNELGISALPFLFEDFDSAWSFMDSDVVAGINENLEEYNIHVLAHFDNGFRCITTKDKAINTPEDMVGLNIRTPDNRVVQETMTALGALPKTLGFSELYAALKDGSFDAQENPIPIIYNNKFYEVQSYLAITNHSYDAMPFVISNEAWKALTPEEQEVVQQAATNAQKTDRDLIRQQTEEYIGKLEAEGMTITHPDLTVFKEKTENVKDFFNYDESLLESVMSIIQ